MPWCPSPVVQKGLKYSFPWSNIFCFHDIRCTNYVEIYLEILQDIFFVININFLTTLSCMFLIVKIIWILNSMILYVQQMVKDVLQIRFEVRSTLTHIKHVFVIIQISNVFSLIILQRVFLYVWASIAAGYWFEHLTLWALQLRNSFM